MSEVERIGTRNRGVAYPVDDDLWPAQNQVEIGDHERTGRRERDSEVNERDVAHALAVGVADVDGGNHSVAAVAGVEFTIRVVVGLP